VSFRYPAPAIAPDAAPPPDADVHDARDVHPDLPRAALCDLDLGIPQGQHVAILGPSGAGKTTLVHLLTRLRDPDTGQVRLGGTDLRSLRESELRRQVTAVEQRTHLFSGTLRDNLRMGRPDADDDALRAVLARVRLPLSSASFPRGLDTWLSGTGDPSATDGSRRLSGGEARRIALARALLRDPPVLILDEPTEDLDPPTARRLLTDLLAARQGRTLVLITHRRVALRRVHRVLLLEQGRLVEQGSHEELLAAGGRYAARWSRLGTDS
jgi:ATP-binding cassette subfamily C protein CydC